MKYFGLIVLFALAFGGYYLWNRMPIINGYTAKCACTQYFENQRPISAITDEDFNVTALKLASIHSDEIEKSVSSTTFGLRERKAIYIPNLGCKLLKGTDDYRFNLPPTDKLKLSDTITWPYGLKMPNTLPAEVDQSKLPEIINVAFDPNQQMVDKKTRSLLIVYKDTIILEAYEDGFHSDTPILGWSMTKSWMNSLIGSLVLEGKIKLSQDRLFPHWTDERAQITLDNLLTMTSGIDWEEDYSTISDATKMLYMSENIVEAANDNLLKYEPGTFWYYSSGTSNMLSGIIRNQFKSHDEYLAYPYKVLFNKLGMNHSFIETDEYGNYIGSSYGYASTRDWAKYGLLYLHDGVWNGERILPEGWIDYTQKEVPSSNGEYGAHFWLNKRGVVYPDAPHDTYSANGYLGQRVFIIPSKDLVIVRTGLNSDFDFNTLISTTISSINYE